MLGRAVLQARTSTQSTQCIIRSFRRFVSTTPSVRSTPATATNRVCILPSPIRSLILHTGAEATLTRFWKTVNLQDRGDDLSISLDSRSLKTPAGKPLLLPRSKRLAATLIVTEWENQREVLKSHALPVVCDLCQHLVKRSMSVN